MALNQSEQDTAEQDELAEKLHGIVPGQNESIAKLTAEVSHLRKLTLVIIDDAQGETKDLKGARRLS